METNCLDDSLVYAKKKLELARLEESEISPIIQSLSVGEDQEDLYLLQLNNDIMNQITEGQILMIRGDPNESAVICTDSCTYELKEAETSNSLLVLPQLQLPDDSERGDLKVIPQTICGIFHTYLEMRNFRPSFKKLRSILENSSYKGFEHEDALSENYTFDKLLDFIQASREELEEALVDLQTCNIDGYVRIIDFDYKFNVLSQIVNAVESRSVPLNKIPKNMVVDMLDDLVPRDILEKCFFWYTYETDDLDEDGTKLYAFQEDTVCRMYAEILLRAAGKFHLAEFLESWQKSVPEGMTCDLSQLHGLALTDMNYRPEVIFHFPVDDMPENIADRFTKLFKVKEKWSYDEIVPYLQDRAVVGNDVKALLIKYTRESTKDGIKLYSSKW